MLAFMKESYTYLGQLQEHLPSLESEWVKCRKGLDFYRKELQEIRNQEQTSMVDTKSQSGQSSVPKFELDWAGRFIQSDKPFTI